MRIGLDIGYSSVKIAYGTGRQPAILTMPVGAAPLSRMGKTMEGQRSVGSGHLVMVNDVEWVAGVDPSEIPKFARTMDEAYPETSEYLALFRAALSAVGAPVVDALTIGLPVSQFRDEKRRSALEQRLQGRHYIRPDMVVDVRFVKVVMQPSGALAAHFDVQKDLPAASQFTPQDTVLVVDPGHFSLDWVAWRKSWNEDAAGTTTSAGEEILRAAAAELNRRYEVNVRVRPLERAVLEGRTSLMVGEVEVPIQEVLEEEASKIIDLNLKVIRGSVRRVNEEDGLDVILVTGGGARLFAPSLRKNFPESRVIVATDSVMANARGFYQIAAMAARRAAAEAAA